MVNIIKNGISSAVENSTVLDGIHDEGAVMKTIGVEYSDGYEDQKVESLEIDVGKAVRIPLEDGDQTYLRRTSFRRRQSISTVNVEKSIAQNIAAINSENANTDVVCSKLVS